MHLYVSSLLLQNEQETNENLPLGLSLSLPSQTSGRTLMYLLFSLTPLPLAVFVFSVKDWNQGLHTELCPSPFLFFHLKPGTLSVTKWPWAELEFMILLPQPACVLELQVCTTTCGFHWFLNLCTTAWERSHLIRPPMTSTEWNPKGIFSSKWTVLRQLWARSP